MTSQTPVEQEWPPHWTRYTHPQKLIDDLLTALEAVLAHVEDTEAQRVGGQCTLCNTYRNTIIRPVIDRAKGGGL